MAEPTEDEGPSFKRFTPILEKIVSSAKLLVCAKLAKPSPKTMRFVCFPICPSLQAARFYPQLRTGYLRVFKHAYWKKHVRGLRDFYRPFIAPGALVFDIGANVGEYAQAFLALGARVVAVSKSRPGRETFPASQATLDCPCVCSWGNRGNAAHAPKRHAYSGYTF